MAPTRLKHAEGSVETPGCACQGMPRACSGHAHPPRQCPPPNTQHQCPPPPPSIRAGTPRGLVRAGAIYSRPVVPSNKPIRSRKLPPEDHDPEELGMSVPHYPPWSMPDLCDATQPWGEAEALPDAYRSTAIITSDEQGFGRLVSGQRVGGVYLSGPEAAQQLIASSRTPKLWELLGLDSSYADDFFRGPDYRYAVDDQGLILDMVLIKRQRIPQAFQYALTSQPPPPQPPQQPQQFQQPLTATQGTKANPITLWPPTTTPGALAATAVGGVEGAGLQQLGQARTGWGSRQQQQGWAPGQQQQQQGRGDGALTGQGPASMQQAPQTSPPTGQDAQQQRRLGDILGGGDGVGLVSDGEPTTGAVMDGWEQGSSLEGGEWAGDGDGWADVVRPAAAGQQEAGQRDWGQAGSDGDGQGEERPSAGDVTRGARRGTYLGDPGASADGVARGMRRAGAYLWGPGATRALDSYLDDLDVDANLGSGKRDANGNLGPGPRDADGSIGHGPRDGVSAVPGRRRQWAGAGTDTVTGRVRARLGRVGGEGGTGGGGGAGGWPWVEFRQEAQDVSSAGDVPPSQRQQGKQTPRIGQLLLVQQGGTGAAAAAAGGQAGMVPGRTGGLRASSKGGTATAGAGASAGAGAGAAPGAGGAGAAPGAGGAGAGGAGSAAAAAAAALGGGGGNGAALRAFPYCIGPQQVFQGLWELDLLQQLSFTDDLESADLVLHRRARSGENQFAYNRLRARAQERGIPFVTVKDGGAQELAASLIPVFQLYRGQLTPEEVTRMYGTTGVGSRKRRIRL